MLRTLMAGVAALAALQPVHATAQASSEVTLFAKGHFKGPHYTITGPTQFQFPFVTKSVQLPSGAQWEFCSGNTYTGCRQVGQSVPSMVMNVRSARPVASILTSSASPQGQSVRGVAGQSLRGLASEYFVAPDQGGNRVEVQPATAEAMSQRAVEFCRSRGWHASPYARLQTVGGKFYLADVLCADTGG